jgi:photosystem II stability/assembly factor-like uncharacterized protein
MCVTRPGPVLRWLAARSIVLALIALLPAWATSVAPAQPVAQDLTSIYVGALAADPSKPGRVYAAGASFSDTDSTIFASDDDGVTWSALSRPGVGIVLSLTVDPVGVVYIADRLTGLLKSTDYGASWTRLDFPPQSAKQMAVDPTDPSVLYAVPGYPWGVFRSADGGDTWSELPLPFPCDLGIVALDPSAPERLFAAGGCGVLRSDDQGMTWELLPLDVGGVATLLVTPTALYAGADGGLWRGDDAGGSWTRVGDFRNVAAVVSDPRDPRGESIVIAAYQDTVPGAFWSPDRGATWITLGGQGGEPRALTATRTRALLAIDVGVSLLPLPHLRM